MLGSYGASKEQMSAGRGALAGLGGWEADDASGYVHYTEIVSQNYPVLPLRCFAAARLGNTSLFT